MIQICSCNKATCHISIIFESVPLTYSRRFAHPSQTLRSSIPCKLAYRPIPLKIKRTPSSKRIVNAVGVSKHTLFEATIYKTPNPNTFPITSTHYSSILCSHPKILLITHVTLIRNALLPYSTLTIRSQTISSPFAAIKATTQSATQNALS